MPQRKVWNQKQDQILKFLREQQGQRKWSVIARKMEQQFRINGRTGKQCRQRYHNHLDSNIVTYEWTVEEEKILFQLHEEVGNKWSIISQKLPGRSDNCVKNHFYSKLRKTVRKLNKMTYEHFRRDFKEIKISLLNKIIETTQERFKVNSKIDQYIIESCIDIKNKLFLFEINPNPSPSEEFESAKNLLQAIFNFEQKCRKSTRFSQQEKQQDKRLPILPIVVSKSQKSPKNTHKIEPQQITEEVQPLFLIFKRVCEEIMRTD